MKSVSFDSFLWHGRNFDHEGIRWANNTCCAFSCHFFGRRLEADILTNGPEKMTPDMQCYLLLTVNGESFPIKLEQTETHLVLADFEIPIEAEITLLKRTEQQYASFGVKEIFADEDAVITPTEEKSRKRLILGDSLTCGYGNAGAPSDPFDTKQEYGEMSYGKLAADELDAEIQFVSRSGIGLYSSYTEIPNHRETSILIRDLLPYADAIGCEDLGIDKVLWDKSRYTPDAIIINLGTNDGILYTSGGEEQRWNYAKDYMKLVEELHEDYPDAEVVVTIGPINPETTRLFSKLLYLVEERRLNGDDKVSCCLFPFATHEEGMGAVGHASLATDKSMAKHLAAHLKLRVFDRK